LVLAAIELMQQNTFNPTLLLQFLENSKEISAVVTYQLTS